ncbi:MAG: EcsC family protein [Selenomonadaceae bacterium]|nr:EcsC family protein [Selenomonadaceae bacterium]
MSQTRNSYEDKQVSVIKNWMNEEPGVVSQTFGFIAKPLTSVVQAVIPEAAIIAVLNGANSMGEFLADESDILRDGNVSKIEDLRNKDLKISDELANSVHNWAIALAAGEGGVAGATGVVGIAADIPTILTLALRTIHKIGLCYGYRANNKAERDFVLTVLSAAGANSQIEKIRALATLKAIEVIIQKQSWKNIEKKIAEYMGKETAIKAIKTLAKQLGINFSKRKALQAIPLMGAGIGAAVNADFMRDVGYAAIHSYQRRWLDDKDKWN